MSKVDVLIVGQGIAGSVMAHHTIRRGLSVAIVDTALPGRSSYAAGGLINPVTGRRVKKSWNYDVFYEHLVQTYTEIDEILGIKSLHLLPIHRMLATIEDVNNWEVQRLEAAYQDYMKEIIFDLDEKVVPHAGAGVIAKGGWLDTVKFLTHFKKYLQEQHVYLEEIFDYEALQSNSYKNIEFGNIIFCEGYKVHQNPFFKDVHLWSTKGETLIIQIEGEDLEYILNKNMLIIPMGNHLYKVGATLERNEDTSITEKGLQELKEKVASVIQVPYAILQQDAGIRPNVRDRKPLIGVSKEYSNYYIFNGLGSKGVSLAPYFAEHLLESIYDGQVLQSDVNWQRIYKK